MTEKCRSLFQYENEIKISWNDWITTYYFTQIRLCVEKGGFLGWTPFHTKVSILIQSSLWDHDHDPKLFGNYSWEINSIDRNNNDTPSQLLCNTTEAVFQYYHSGTTLHVYSDTYYLSKPNGQIMASGLIFLSQRHDNLTTAILPKTSDVYIVTINVTSPCVLHVSGYWNQHCKLIDSSIDEKYTGASSATPYSYSCFHR